MENTCKRCKWWEPIVKSRGRCMAYPPRVIAVFGEYDTEPYANYETMWPETKPEDRCKEYEKK